MAPPRWKESLSIMPSMVAARASSQAACRSMSMVRATVPPGWGCLVNSSPVTWPWLSVVMSRLPSTPWRYCSKAFSTPLEPTRASME